MPDHFFDELDRDEIDLFGDAGESIREKLREWLGEEPSQFQTSIAMEKVSQMESLAASAEFRISVRGLMRGRTIVHETVLTDARGRVVITGATRMPRAGEQRIPSSEQVERSGMRKVRQFLEEEIGF